MNAKPAELRFDTPQVEDRLRHLKSENLADDNTRRQHSAWVTCPCGDSPPSADAVPRECLTCQICHSGCWEVAEAMLLRSAVSCWV